jgi:hypothetical protein
LHVLLHVMMVIMIGCVLRAACCVPGAAGMPLLGGDMATRS